MFQHLALIHRSIVRPFWARFGRGGLLIEYRNRNRQFI